MIDDKPEEHGADDTSLPEETDPDFVELTMLDRWQGVYRCACCGEVLRDLRRERVRRSVRAGEEE